MAAKTRKDESTLLEVLDAHLPPLLETWQRQRLLLAQATRQEFLRINSPLAPGVAVEPKPIVGRCIKARRNMPHAMEPVVAYWPDDNLIVTRTPFLICPLRGSAHMQLGDYLLHLPEGHLCLLGPEVPRPYNPEPHLLEGGGHCDLLWIKGGEHDIEVWVCHSEGERHWIGFETARVAVQAREALAVFSCLLYTSPSPRD